MDWRERYAPQLCSAAEAIGRIAPGQCIFIGSGAAEPPALVEALTQHGAHLSDNEVVHILTLGPAPYVAPAMAGRFRHTAFFIGPNVRDAVQSGRADFVPVFLSELPGLIRSRRVNVEVALLQVSPPDERGYCSLGVSVDVVAAAVEAASLVIAQVNPNMPRTLGASSIPVSKLDLLLDAPAALYELTAEPIDDVAAAIGANVASLVPDGATLQTGIGRIPNAVLRALSSRHDLGVHTEMLSDGLMELAKLGVITGARKTLRQGRMVTSFVMGTRRLYDWVDQNPHVELQPSDFTNDPFVISKNARMIAINSALSVDLTGQVAADSIGGRFFSGIGGQVDFIRGAARSPGGKPIIVLPSMAAGGTKSRIVTTLGAGAGVVTSRGDVHYVVTEYGIAQLWGKSIRARASALIEIAHPDVRPDLLNEAKARHFVLPDQPAPNPPPPAPDQIESLPTGEQVRVRAVRISDESALQQLLYHLRDESIFFRFFGHTHCHPHHHVLRMVEVDDARSLALAVCLSGTEELLGIARADMDARSGVAELGVIIAEDWQGKRIGSVLLEHLTRMARARGFRVLVAQVLPGNRRMQRLLRGQGFYCSGQPGEPLTFRLPLREEAA